MTTVIQAIRGMNDILPAESTLWQHVENILKKTIKSFGYQEIRFPIVEKTDLFKRSIGEATDIVEKEMYTFLDRNGDSLTLRPEGTAGCVRTGIEHGLFYNQIQRLWYLGPFFRHERPQKGRYRQFHQFGVEIFGIDSADADAELILISAAILKKLQLLPHVKLQINSLGSALSRIQYKTKLVEYLSQHKAALDEDSLRRLDSNPLRILDSKNPALQAIIQDAPKLMDHLDEDSLQHFNQLRRYLDALGIEYQINTNLVRGLDYYTKTVFEWVTNDLGAQGAVCSGGRYDGLVQQLGGQATPALGFGLGMERIILLLQTLKKETHEHQLDFFFITDTESSFVKGLLIANQIREHFPKIRILNNCGGSIKSQFKRADKSGAKFALILGENEMANNTITIKFLRENSPQMTIEQSKLVDTLRGQVFGCR